MNFIRNKEYATTIIDYCYYKQKNIFSDLSISLVTVCNKIKN